MQPRISSLYLTTVPTLVRTPSSCVPWWLSTKRREFESLTCLRVSMALLHITAQLPASTSDSYNCHQLYAALQRSIFHTPLVCGAGLLSFQAQLPSLRSVGRGRDTTNLWKSYGIRIYTGIIWKSACACHKNCHLLFYTVYQYITMYRYNAGILGPNIPLLDSLIRSPCLIGQGQWIARNAIATSPRVPVAAAFCAAVCTAPA